MTKEGKCVSISCSTKVDIYNSWSPKKGQEASRSMWPLTGSRRMASNPPPPNRVIEIPRREGPARSVAVETKPSRGVAPVRPVRASKPVAPTTENKEKPVAEEEKPKQRSTTRPRNTWDLRREQEVGAKMARVYWYCQTMGLEEFSTHDIPSGLELYDTGAVLLSSIARQARKGRFFIELPRAKGALFNTFTFQPEFVAQVESGVYGERPAEFPKFEGKILTPDETKEHVGRLGWQCLFLGLETVSEHNFKDEDLNKNGQFNDIRSLLFSLRETRKAKMGLGQWLLIGKFGEFYFYPSFWEDLQEGKYGPCPPEFQKEQPSDTNVEPPPSSEGDQSPPVVEISPTDDAFDEVERKMHEELAPAQEEAMETWEAWMEQEDFETPPTPETQIFAILNGLPLDDQFEVITNLLGFAGTILSGVTAENERLRQEAIELNIQLRQAQRELAEAQAQLADAGEVESERDALRERCNELQEQLDHKPIT